MKKFLIVFIAALLVFIPSCDHNAIPNVPEPSDADKAVLNDTEKAILQKVVVASFGDSVAMTDYEMTTVVEGATNTSTYGENKFTNGTVKITARNAFEQFSSSGKLDDVNFSFEYNYDFTLDNPDKKDINSYKDTSYVKFNSNTWKKGDENFTKFVTENVSDADGDLYTAFRAMIASSAMETWTKGNLKATFKLENATVDFSDLGISDVTIASASVSIDEDMGSSSKDSSTENNSTTEFTVHTILGKTTISYKDSNNASKTLTIDSSNLVYKSKDSGQTISAVKKGADIKVDGKQVKLSELFDSSILY